MLKKILTRMFAMCPAAWYIFKRGIQLSTLLILLAVIALIRYDGELYANIYYYKLAFSLNETAQAVFLIAVLASFIAEDIITQEK